LTEDKVPLFTTRRLSWKNIITELIWFIKGQTDSKILEAQGNRIWKGNSTREFLDKRGLSHYKEGDIGPGYGFQWRHFGAKYKGCEVNYTGEGVDQLKEVVRLVKEDPFSRRIIMTAWNPACMNEMALPACHKDVQFYVSADRKELSCQVYQRSADMALGIPYVVAGYATLTHIIASMAGMKAKELIVVYGDCHIYKNHIDGLQELIKRQPKPSPKLDILRDITDIDDVRAEDFQINGYEADPIIKMDMSA
jgi:thymidylate synthase